MGLLLSLLAAQLLIAQHFTAHIGHDSASDFTYVEHTLNDSHDHDERTPLAEKLCDLCLLNQNLVHGLVALQSNVLPRLDLQGVSVFISNEAPQSFAVSHFKQTRAPPSFLI